MNLRIFTYLLLLTVASCNGEFPRDPDETLARIRSEQSFRVALVAPLAAGTDPKVDALLAGLGKASGARPRLEQGSSELLLNRLEEGELDLVIGRFEKKTPWARLVTLGPPLRVEKQGKVTFHLAPVMKNGENAWISLVEREARNAAPEAQ